MQVTDAMAQAAVDRYCALDHNGLSPLPHAMREAVQAALDVMPLATGGAIDAPPIISDRCFPAAMSMGTPRIYATTDAERHDLAILAAIQQATPDQRTAAMAALTAEPVVDDNGVQGPGVTDATGQGEISVNEPTAPVSTIGTNDARR